MAAGRSCLATCPAEPRQIGAERGRLTSYLLDDPHVQTTGDKMHVVQFPACCGVVCIYQLAEFDPDHFSLKLDEAERVARMNLKGYAILATAGYQDNLHVFIERAGYKRIETLLNPNSNNEITIWGKLLARPTSLMFHDAGRICEDPRCDRCAKYRREAAEAIPAIQPGND